MNCDQPAFDRHTIQLFQIVYVWGQLAKVLPFNKIHFTQCAVICSRFGKSKQNVFIQCSYRGTPSVRMVHIYLSGGRKQLREEEFKNLKAIEVIIKPGFDCQSLLSVVLPLSLRQERTFSA